MVENNKIAENAIQSLLMLTIASGLLQQGYGLIPEGKFYTAGAKNIIDLAQGGVVLAGAFSVLNTGAKMILNSKEATR